MEDQEARGTKPTPHQSQQLNREVFSQQDYRARNEKQLESGPTYSNGLTLIKGRNNKNKIKEPAVIGYVGLVKKERCRGEGRKE